MKLDLSKFTNKKDLFSYLVANKSMLIELGKSQIKFADSFGAGFVAYQETIKSLNTNYKDDPTSGVIKRTAIANTYYFMDSHDDVHVENTFGKSIANRSTPVYHLHDHKHERTAQVGKIQKVYEDSVKWSDLGVNVTGKTTALFIDSNIIQVKNPVIFDEYLKNEVDQHSVGMRYVDIELALNDSDYKAEFATWKKYIDSIGNKSHAEDKGYFWAVKEAELIEVSAVLQGSNILTPGLPNEPKKEIQNNNKQINLNEVISIFKL